MKRPRIDIQPDFNDRIIELIGLIGLLILIGLPTYYYGKLPEEIPTHYGVSGQPDDFNSKGFIWLMPIIAVPMYFILLCLNRYPHIFNYPQEVTEDNAEHLYTIATKMIRSINTVISCVFAYLTYSTIQTALGKQDGLGTYFIPIFMIILFSIIGYSTYYSTKKK